MLNITKAGSRKVIGFDFVDFCYNLLNKGFVGVSILSIETFRGNIMKSSTLRRSTLSKEAMDVIEALSKQQPIEENVIEYIREDNETTDKSSDDINKAQEIDMLWQNFKSSQFGTNSPFAYITIGFISGLIFTILCTWVAGSYLLKTGRMSLNKYGIYKAATQYEVQEDKSQQQEPTEQSIQDEVVQAEQIVEQEQISQKNEQKSAENQSNNIQVPPQDNIKTKKYIVKSGDTGESIIKKMYGSYTPERAEKIIKINNLKNLDRINIDQELLIPVE